MGSSDTKESGLGDLTETRAALEGTSDKPSAKTPKVTLTATHRDKGCGCEARCLCLRASKENSGRPVSQRHLQPLQDTSSDSSLDVPRSCHHSVSVQLSAMWQRVLRPGSAETLILYCKLRTSCKPMILESPRHCEITGS